MCTIENELNIDQIDGGKKQMVSHGSAVSEVTPDHVFVWQSLTDSTTFCLHNSHI